MSRAPTNNDEKNRLTALSEYGVNEPLSDPDFDNLVRLAANVFNVPIVQISLLEEERLLFAASVGISTHEATREASFCTYAILRKRMLVVPDARKDPRFKNNPMVVGDPHIRFYAGIPLRTASGYPIGALSIIDNKPRASLSARDAHNLQDLATLVMDRLEMRRLDLARKSSQACFESVSESSPDSVLCVNDKGIITYWNQAAEKCLEYTGEQIIGEHISTIIPDMFVVQLHHLATDKVSLFRKSAMELEARTLSGTLVPVELSVSMWQSDNQTRYGAILRDVTDRKRYEERLFLQAHRDPLTGLANRTLLASTLDHVLKSALAVAVLIIDLDGFKDINDSLGHSSGDEILTSVAKRLQANARPEDLVARMGGDEFAMLLPGLNTEALVADLAERIIHDISQVVQIDNQQINISASIGIVISPSHGMTSQDLLTSADLALYKAQSDGRNCYRFFTRELREVFQARHAFQLEFIRAYEQKEFEVFYQPQVSLISNKVVGAEALLRWRHPYKGLLTPAVFLSALERGPWAERIGDWVVETACQQAAEWYKGGAENFRISINLFAAQFRSGMLAQKIQSVLAKSGLKPSSLELEITENIILRYDENMLKPLNELRNLGVGIAFDDYGTGYASLSMLKNYPVTRLKIDQTFVRTMCDSAPDAAIVRAILYLGKSFGLDVIAEGVETEDQCERLRNKGCEQAQGYLFGRPMPSTEFEKLLELGG
ncbi:putative bifunctional diguanylate cyclase/phosphodiesterase [Musicola keenii]|uniref:putative bifunctional diguanylate cyclase/phosphodiesterase n=1 Tax=Musicola keenii TaxID=2884250 RepID=UPI00177C211B|nr:EAL domain-containing protein [Musicola keenii]